MTIDQVPVLITIIGSFVTAAIWISKELEKTRDFSRSNVKVLAHKLEVEVSKSVEKFENKTDRIQKKVDDLEKIRLLDKAELKNEISKERHKNNNQDMIINAFIRKKRE